MRITAIEAYLVDIPFRVPFVVWRGSIGSKQHVLVKVTTDKGLIGWGEASPFLYYAPETAPDVLNLVVDFMREELIGTDPCDIRSCMHRFEMLDGHEFAKAAIETALWDILGKHLHVPVYRLLGGSAHLEIPVLTVLHAANPEEMAREAVEWTNFGLKRLKLKIGFGADQDVAKVAKVREAVGSDIKLRVDAEEHYQVKDALKIARRLERFDIELMSQPIARTDWTGMAFLKQHLEMPLLADEGIHSVHDVLTCVQHLAADMVNIKVLKSGGALTSMEMGALCNAANLPVVIGSMIESGIGSLMGAHVAKAMPAMFSTELCGPFLLADDLLDSPLAVVEGNLMLPDTPGLGADVDQMKLAKYLVSDDNGREHERRV